jgi:hypothetical protein
VGPGKLQEIKAYIKEKEDTDEKIGLVIFDDELTPKQHKNIDKELEIKVLDRTSLNSRQSLQKEHRHRTPKHNVEGFSTNICFLA